MPKSIFDNTEIAFKGKSNFELKKAKALFWFMGFSNLTRFLGKCAKWALSIHLPIKWIIKKTIYEQFCGGETLEEGLKVAQKLHQHNVYSILDYSAEGQEEESSFEKTKENLIAAIGVSKDKDSIPCYCLKVSGFESNSFLEKISSSTNKLSEEEIERKQKMESRLDYICSAAYSTQKPIYIDAEESWIQPAIDNLCEELMLKYNKQWGCVHTTIQLYRKDRLLYLNQLIEFAKTHNLILGVKLVRGAYLEKETARAQTLNIENPINDTKENTDQDYDEAVELCLKNIDCVSLCLGTHNILSCKKAIEKMDYMNIDKTHKHVWFSQLFGMSDHITFNLAHLGYNTSKYLPFGPIKYTIPYLIRRAEENSGIKGQMSQELRLYVKELRRRALIKKVNACCRKKTL